MMRVLLVHPFAQAISGPDRSILTVMAELVPQGVHYDVILPGPGPFQEQYEAHGCRVYHAPLAIIKRRTDLRYMAGFLRDLFKGHRALRRIIAETAPDLVHVNGAVLPGAGWAARRSGVPCVHHIRCTAVQHPACVAGPLAWSIAATSARVIAISSACGKLLSDRGKGDRVEVIFNGIDLVPFQQELDPNHWRSILNLPEDAPVIGQVGRIGPDKGWLEFVQACALIRDDLPTAHFVAVGEAHRELEKKYLARVRTEADTLGLADCLHFVGRHDNIAEVMRGLDVFITSAREEGLGRVAIEAMAAGVPVVANDVHGLREVVLDGETGLLAGPNDPAATASAALRILYDNALAMRLAEQGRARAFSVFSAAECAQRTLGVYEGVLRPQRT